MKTKNEVLIANGWEVFEGYCFPSPPADEDQYTFVEKEECERIFKEGSKIYYWNEGRERLYSEEDAWEEFMDYYFDDIPEGSPMSNMTYEEIEKELLK